MRGEVVSQEQIANLLADRLPRLPPQAVRMLSALYVADQPLGLYAIMDAVPPLQRGKIDRRGFDRRDDGIVRVWAVKIRRALGARALRTVWSEGYELTAEGRDHVARLISA